MSTQSFNSALLDLIPDTIIELYEIDLGEQDGVFRFHPGIVGTENLIFGGHPYRSLPVDAEGFQKKGDGKMPRPMVRIANVDGSVSDIIKTRNDLVGFLFTRKRVFLKYIDNVNFPNNFNPFGVPDPDSRYKDDHFIINRKSQENKIMIEMELISPLEYENTRLPARIMIANYCPWKYRGAGCKYGCTTGWNNKQKIKVGSTEYNPDEPLAFGQAGNLGFPIADDKDNLFYEKEGYNITSFAYRGDYDKTVTNYSVGNVVRFRPKIKILSKFGLVNTSTDLNNSPDIFYVCIKDNGATAKDPRYYKEYWVADQCSKTLDGCKLRWQHYGEYPKGLPFGGFPSIESYRF